MASWAEIENLRKDADGARRLCRGLLNGSASALSDTAETFLESIEARHYLDELSTRQAEVILEIRDEVQFVTVTRDGLSVATLIARCHALRDELADPDKEWIEAIFTSSRSTVRRKDIGRLLRCSRSLGLFDD